MILSATLAPIILFVTAGLYVYYKKQHRGRGEIIFEVKVLDDREAETKGACRGVPDVRLHTRRRGSGGVRTEPTGTESDGCEGATFFVGASRGAGPATAVSRQLLEERLMQRPAIHLS